MHYKIDRQVADVIAAQSLLMLIPLAAMPLIITRYGMNGLGILALAQSTAAIIAIVYELGYSIRNQKRASELFLYKESMYALFVETFIAKTTLMTITLLLANIFMWSNLTSEKIISYNLMTLSHFFLAVIPNFYFYAAERVRVLMIINVLTRLFPLIFLLLHEYLFLEEKPPEILFYMIVILLANACNLCMVLYIFFKSNLFTKKIKINEVQRSLIEAWKFAKISYLSQLTIHLPIQILALIVNNDILGQYSLAEKLVNAVKAVQSQVLLMYQSKALGFLQIGNKNAPLRIVQKSYGFMMLMALFVICSVITLVLIQKFELIDYYYFSYTLVILGLTPLLIHLSSLINIHVFANQNDLYPANVSLTAGLIICSGLMFVCYYFNIPILVPISVFLVEFSVLLVASIFLFRRYYEN